MSELRPGSILGSVPRGLAPMPEQDPQGLAAGVPQIEPGLADLLARLLISSGYRVRPEHWADPLIARAQSSELSPGRMNNAAHIPLLDAMGSYVPGARVSGNVEDVRPLRPHGFW